MPQKKWKFNIIDIIAVLLIAAVIVFAGAKLLPKSSGGEGEMIPMTYTVIAESQPEEMFEAVQQYIPCRLVAAGALFDAEVTAVEARPSLVCSGGVWVEDPRHVDLIFTVSTELERTPVLLPTVALQEIRIGNEIILKTEYLEFDPAYVLSVEYGG